MTPCDDHRILKAGDYFIAYQRTDHGKMMRLCRVVQTYTHYHNYAIVMCINSYSIGNTYTYEEYGPDYFDKPDSNLNSNDYGYSALGPRDYFIPTPNELVMMRLGEL